MTTSSVDNDMFFEELESKKRLEREKKIQRKKVKDEEDRKTKKPHGKQKKMKNIDWTKGYDKGIFEDGDLYDTYMR